MIRNFMRHNLPHVMDILFIISIIGVAIAAYSVGYNFTRDGASFLIPFISVLLPGVVGVIVAFGIFFVLLDIRDVLQGKKPE